MHTFGRWFLCSASLRLTTLDSSLRMRLACSILGIASATQRESSLPAAESQSVGHVHKATRHLDDWSLLASSILNGACMRLGTAWAGDTISHNYLAHAVLMFASAAALFFRKRDPARYHLSRAGILLSLRALQLCTFASDALSLRSVISQGCTFTAASRAASNSLWSHPTSIMQALRNLLSFSLAIVPLAHTIGTLQSLPLEIVSASCAFLFLVATSFWPAVHLLSLAPYQAPIQQMCRGLNSLVYLVERVILVGVPQDKQLLATICEERPAWPLVLFAQALLGFFIPLWISYRVQRHLSWLNRLDKRHGDGARQPHVQLLPHPEAADLLVLGTTATALWVAAMVLHVRVAGLLAAPINVATCAS